MIIVGCTTDSKMRSPDERFPMWNAARLFSRPIHKHARASGMLIVGARFTTCVCRKSDSAILMVKAAKNRS